MKRSIKYTLLVFIHLQVMCAFSQYDDESFTYLSVEDGLSSSVVTAILKDSRGFMWFGTQNGLNRYDAYSFTTYFRSDTIKGSISGNFVLSIYEDSDSILWVGTERNGLNRYNRLKDSFTVYRHIENDPTSLPGNSIYDMLETSKSELLVGTNRGIVVFNKDKNTFSPLQLPEESPGFSRAIVREIYEDKDQSIWMGTDNGLFHFDPNSNELEHYKYDSRNIHSLSNNSINQVLRDSEDRLIIATNEGINIFHDKNKTFSRHYYNPEAADSRAKSEVQTITYDNKGNFWIGSFGGGLIKSKPDGLGTVVFTVDPDNPETLSSDYINALYFDEAGILWIGTYGGGVNKIDQVRIRFENIRHRSGDPNTPAGKEVYAIYTDEEYLYFGTEKGLSICNRQTSIYKHFRFDPANPNSLSGNIVYSIEKDAHGNVWIGTAGRGINKLQHDENAEQGYRIERFTADEHNDQNLAGNDILALQQVSRGDLWVGTNKGISVIRDEVVVAGFGHNPGQPGSLSHEEVYCIFEDSKKQMWIGTYRGLNLFNASDSTFITFDSIPVLINSTIYSILEDKELLWIGTDNAGLIRFDPANPKNWKIYTKADGLPDNVIYGILKDGEDNLWMSSNNGIFKVIRQDDSDKITVVAYNSSNWLNTDAFNIGAYHKDRSGILYFGSFDGVTMFLPENVKGNDYIPPVYITAFELFFEPVQISDDGSTPLNTSIVETGRIVLSHDQNVLKFGFTALNYIEPEENRFAFMMEGLENTWNYTQSQREAQYLYLPPGEYRFRVRAANNDGLWNNEGAAVDIIIKPPFTQTVWFYLLLLGGLLLIGWWIMHIRTKRLKIIRNRLEEQVQKRTFELRETNKNLEAEISERLKVEEALKKSEARFRQLIETMNEGFSVQDKEGRINYVNPRLCEMFGYTADEIIGHFPTDFVDKSDPDNLAKFKEKRDEGIKTGVVPSYELKWQHKNGTVFETMVSPKPIIDPDEGYTGSVAVLTDITDLKNAENELISKNQALNAALDDLRKTQAQLIDSEKMASLGQLTAGVAHEINNPINFVSGNVQPLRRDIQDILDVLHQYDRIVETMKLEDSFEKIRELKEEIDFEFVLQEINNLLDGIGEGAHRTAEIVKGLRNFSRMDEHELKPASINQGLDSTLLILHNKLKQRIEVIKEYGNIPDIMCYPGQLNQVFMNVINNAVEAIDGEGTIIIRTWQENNRVKVSVKDSGKGMPEKIRKRIFEPFYTTKEVGKGTGLGLSISFGIIEKHNGKIEVKSQPDKGTEFIISVPVDLK